MLLDLHTRNAKPNRWQLLEADAEIPRDGDVLVPLKRWLEERESIGERSGQTGVWLETTDEPGGHIAQLIDAPTIAIRFRALGDGRGISLGVLLRRDGCHGELIALGRVLADQFWEFSRCGFDAIDIGERDAASLPAFVFSEAYQGATIQPEPLFRRRTEAKEDRG